MQCIFFDTPLEYQAIRRAHSDGVQWFLFGTPLQYLVRGQFVNYLFGFRFIGETLFSHFILLQTCKNVNDCSLYVMRGVPGGHLAHTDYCARRTLDPERGTRVRYAVPKSPLRSAVPYPRTAHRMGCGWGTTSVRYAVLRPPRTAHRRGCGGTYGSPVYICVKYAHLQRDARNAQLV